MAVLEAEYTYMHIHMAVARGRAWQCGSTAQLWAIGNLSFHWWSSISILAIAAQLCDLRVKAPMLHGIAAELRKMQFVLVWWCHW